MHRQDTFLLRWMPRKLKRVYLHGLPKKNSSIRLLPPDGISTLSLLQKYLREPAGKPCDDSPAEQRKGLLRQIGKTAILGLGYQMGARHFAQQLANFADITQLCGSEIESKRLAWKIVNSYRNQYRAIPGFWKKLEKEFRGSVTSRSFRELGRLVIASDNRATWVTLPSGRKLIYQATAILPTCIQEISHLNSQGEQVTTPHGTTAALLP